MKLFVITDLKTGLTLPNTYENKKDAKKERNKLNGETKRYIVSPGPDHWKNKKN